MTAGWTIQSAQLTIVNIYDWGTTEKDMLFVHLLDAALLNGSSHWRRISNDNRNDNRNDNNFTDYFAPYPPECRV